MKKLLLLCTFAVALLMCAPPDTNAQGPCGTVPDCPLDPWIGPMTTITTVPGSGGFPCTITVTYCFRIACGTYHDMKILSIGINPECMGDYTPEQLLDFSMKAVWCADPWGDNNIPVCPITTTGWRVYTAGCWYSKLPDPNDPPGSPMTLNPCGTTAQCFALFRLCKSSVDPCVIEVDKVDSFPATYCEPEPTRECFILCP